MEIVSQIENMVPRDSEQSSPTANLIRDMKQMVQKDMINMDAVASK